MIETNRESYYFNNGQFHLSQEWPVHSFTYECEDLIASKIFFDNFEWIRTKEEYFYEGTDNCFDIENNPIEMSIFPNPSQGKVIIKSPIFESGNTQVIVFDISGKLLLEKIEFNRVKQIDLDITSLSNGIYIIQLMTQNHFVREKIVIHK